LLFATTLAVWASLAPGDDAAQRAKDAVVVKALQRLPGIDLASRPEAKAALLRHLATIRGTAAWLELIEKFKLREESCELLTAATEAMDDALAARAAKLLVTWGENERLGKAIAALPNEKAARLVHVLGLAADARTNDLVEPLILQTDLPLNVRSTAVTALARNAPGQKQLLAIVESGQLPADVQFAAANGLLSSSNESIRSAAAKHLSLPAGAGGEPLPPIAELVRRKGNVAHGKELFAGVGTCSKCHKVKGEGKEVGPDLSEIGSKLSKEAMYVSILDPNAGVSFNYETWLAQTLDGTTLSGVLVSQTDDAVELKAAEAIVHSLKRSDLGQLKKLPTSLMPSDLQKQLKAEDLVDLVEYLATLKKGG
jgi:putative heme-binding domain-containing protein